MSTLTDQQRDQLTQLGHLIQAAPLNLMSAKDTQRVAEHITDAVTALQALDLQSVRVAVDIGSGGGIPGLVLAVLAPDTAVHLVESAQRKAAFLADAATTLKLRSRVTVHAERAEDLARLELRDAADLVTGRAVAAAAITLEWMAPLLAPGGQTAYLTTATATDTDALSSVATELELSPPRLVAAPSPLRDDGAVLVATKLAATPERFPRRTGLARTRPLT